MFAEFAVEPAAMVINFDLFVGMIDRFGVDQGRIISDFAQGRWSRAVIEQAEANGFGDIALGSIVERLREKRDEKAVARFRLYPAVAGGWTTNARTSDANAPFGCIVTEAGGCDNPRECRAMDARTDRPPFQVSGFADVARTAEAIADVTRPLARASRALHLIDPHISFFMPAASRWVPPLLALIGLCRPDMVVTIHTDATDGANAADFELQARRRLTPLPPGVCVRIQRWQRRPDGEDFHDRFVLSDIGGMKFGNGLDEGRPGTTVHVHRMDENAWRTILAKFTPETSPFDPEPTIILQEAG